MPLKNRAAEFLPQYLSCRIPETLCAPCAKLAAFDGTSNASIRNSKSQKERRQILSEVNGEHDLLSKRLPVEICAHIIYKCLDDIDFLSKREFSCRSSRGPLRLSQVCRNWRKLAHSFPLLWKLMPIYVSEDDKASLQAVAEVAGKWIRRSGKILPLSIILDITPTIDPNYCRPLFKIIQSCSPRLQFLQIDAPTEVIRRLFSLYKRRPNLTNLRLTSFGLPNNLNMENLPKFKPTHLFLNNATPKSFGIDTTNLTHFASQHLSLVEILDIFSNAHQMTSCTLDYSTYYPAFLLPDLPQPPLVHSALKHLHINASDDDHLKSSVFTFKALNFPSLEILTLRPLWTNQTRLLRAVTDCLRRSDSHLTMLSMKDLSFIGMPERTPFVDLIDAVGPSLRHLDLQTAADFDGETGIIASILNDMSTRLPQLRSAKLFMNGESCVRTLQKLLSASFAIASANAEPVSFVFWTYDHGIRDEGTGAIDFDAVSSKGDELSPVTPAEIHSMVSILRSELLSVKIIVSPYSMCYRRKEHEDAGADLDMTEDVIEALGRLVAVEVPGKV